MAAAPAPTPVPPSAVLVLTGLASAGLRHWRKRRAVGALLCLFLLAGHLRAQTVAHTIVVTNEGGLIDELIASGRGSQSLYQILQFLQPSSYGFISANFMAELAATPLTSEARTVPLSNFAGLNNPVGVNTDGTLLITASFGRDYVGRTGWTYHTGGPGTFALGSVIFGNASTSAYHQLLMSGYEQIAIVWSMPTFEMIGVALSNEGGLMDRLVAGGYGSRPVYDALQHLQPLSQGAISQEFMTQLAAAPRSRDAFTAELRLLADPSNNPIVISPDGEMWVAGIYGRDLRGRAGFNTTSSTSPIAGNLLFTSASAPQYYVDAGANVIIEAGRSGHFFYKATAIAWALAESPPSCSYAVSTPDLAVPAAGGTMPLAIHTDSGCSWSITGLPAWLTVGGDAQRTGSANVTLIASLSSGAARSALLSVGGVSVPVRQLDSSACAGSISCTMHVLTHVAFGGEWTTDLVAIGSGANASSFSVGFHGDSGAAIALPFTGGLGNLPALADTVPGQGRKDYAAADPALPDQGGWGLVTGEDSLVMQAVFRRHTPDGKYYEAAVPTSGGYSRFMVPFDAMTFAPTGAEMFTGFVIDNLNPSETAHIVCTARDHAGTIVPDAVTIPSLGPLGHYTGFAFPLLAGKRGTFDCSADTLLSALALRAIGGDAFSTLPVIVK